MIKPIPNHYEQSQTSVPEECQWTPCPRPDIELTNDEFLAMPHRLGWKHEYWDGMARLSPSRVAITESVLDVRAWSRSRTKPSGASTPIKIDRVQTSCRSDLEQLHQSAFVNSIEYVGYSPTAYVQEVARSIDRYFRTRLADSKHDDQPSTDQHSFVARVGQRIVGAILLIADPEGKQTIQPIMVEPDFRRCGVATTLLEHARCSLANDGVASVHSHCHLGNTASLAWHKRMGFRQRLPWLAAAHLVRHHIQNCEHHRRGGRDSLARLHKELADAYQQLHDQLTPSPSCSSNQD